MFLNSFYALVATFCFGILFNIKGKNLRAATVGGGLGGFVYEIALSLNCSNITGLFFGSIALSAYSEISARRLKSPVTTFVVCALIPLVPGGGMYHTMYASIEGNASRSLELGINTLSCAGAIAIGVLLTSSVARFVNYSKLKKALGKHS